MSDRHAGAPEPVFDTAGFMPVENNARVTTRRADTDIMTSHRIFTTRFASVYPLYIAKAEKKGRTRAEVDQIIGWLTGYSQAELAAQVASQADFQRFFAQAPRPNPARATITGKVCGVRIEDLDDPLMREIRYLDKLIDELAKGRPMEKILRH